MLSEALPIYSGGLGDDAYVARVSTTTGQTKRRLE